MIISASSRPVAGRWRVAAYVLAMMVAALGSLGGCQDVLFPNNTPRTQFEAYDRMRNQAAPEKEFDALGREQPALRARLAPN